MPFYIPAIATLILAILIVIFNRLSRDPLFLVLSILSIIAGFGVNVAYVYYSNQSVGQVLLACLFAGLLGLVYERTSCDSSTARSPSK